MTQPIALPGPKFGPGHCRRSLCFWPCHVRHDRRFIRCAKMRSSLPTYFHFSTMYHVSVRGNFTL
jgi:hypothetical protein